MSQPTVPIESQSNPLADYFFICGIESSKIVAPKRASHGRRGSAVYDAIDEDYALEPDLNGSRDSHDGTNGNKRFSYEPRRSFVSVVPHGSREPQSNRSSVTIRPAPQEEPQQGFEEALLRFATERDNFLDEIKFSAGQSAQPTAPRPRPKTLRIKDEDYGGAKGGSIRRRISTMNNLMRQSTISSRRSSVRTSKRLSGYNSVLPNPQQFRRSANLHPLKRPVEPVLLDQYPPRDKMDDARRSFRFPDYVPMFAFPNDVHVVSSDERPRATWHGFAMTNADNTKIYGICLTIWIPLNHDVADALEKECEEWRRKNMSAEDREFANSLGEKLASERAKLSALLAELSMIASGTEEREMKEDEIGAIEEKIQLMNDLLQPIRLGAASRIPGLTDGDSGFWIPRSYGVLGTDVSMTGFWKEWLRAVVIPMTNGGILRVPPSSPRNGMWQPLERYVVNLCAEALSPMSSITQVELAVRELRMYARKDAVNEIPGSRNIDLYALFRCMDIADIIILFEYVLAESRIILLSSHTAILHLVSAAITQLIYPLKWAGVFIPVLPARLIQALEAPCPYIVGIERRYEAVELPEDDFVLVDLDQGGIEATVPPTSLPRQQRRKLQSILQLAAPHRNRYGVPLGPPRYSVEAYPFDAFSTENPQLFKHNAKASSLSRLANLPSTAFGNNSGDAPAPMFNAFRAQNPDRPGTGSNSRGSTSRGSTGRSSIGRSIGPSPPTSPAASPARNHFAQPSIPRIDSGYALQHSLREKRSGVFDPSLKRKSSFGLDRMQTGRSPSLPFLGHASTHSVSTVGDFSSQSMYAPSVYAQSTLAASTIMPSMLMQPVKNTDTMQWVEGHCLEWRVDDTKAVCSVCEEKADDGVYICNGCDLHSHARCAQQICLVCPSAFHPDQIIAAFVRCFASLFYTYRKYLSTAAPQQKKSGMLYKFNMDSFMRSMPRENAEYVALLCDTQAFNEFIYERETKRSSDPSIRLFDEIILSKRNRGRQSFFSKSKSDFLSDTSDHLWRSALATTHHSKMPSDPKNVMGRIPAKLDSSLMKEPRLVQGVPRANLGNKARRKPVASMVSTSGIGPE